MSRWLRNVGDFLEKLDDVAGEADDDVLAARDLAKSLQQAPSDDDGEHSIAPQTESYGVVDVTSNKEEDSLSPLTPKKQSRTENESNSAESSIGDGEHQEAKVGSVHSPQIQDFQTPVATTPAIDTNESEKFMTPAVDETLSTVDQNSLMMKQLKAKISALESEKLDLSNEARKLRKHMVTLNEHLERADTEIEAQRGELEQAARLLETGRQQAAAKLQSTQQEHAAAVLKLQRDSAERLAAAAQKHQQQQDALRHEILQAHDQHQQEGGDLTNQLQQAAARQEELSNATKDITSERDAAVVHAQRLQGQLESLNDQLDSVTEQAQAASLREQAAAAQLDTVTMQHQTVLQRHRERETDLEQQLAQVSAALAQRPVSAAPSVAHAPSTQESKNIMDDLETCQSQLHAEQEESTRLRAEIQALQSDQSQELYREQMKHEHVVGELRKEISELMEKLANQQPTTSSEDFESQQERLSQQHEKVEALSEQVIRQGELLSRSHGEVAALRARLTAALNRATVAEAAAEAAPLSVPTMRPPRNRRKEQPSMREALGGSKRLDSLDKFLSSSIQILRRHPLARLAALLYLLILHLWTLVLLVFHAHASTATTPELMAAAHGPGTVLRTSGPP